jgi:hypothetical protein
VADQRILYTEQMVGANHPSLADTLNRLVVGVNNFRLIKSGANLTLEPVGGNLVDLNGAIHAYTTMPTLAASGLSVGTTYYIYLYDNAGTATLEASTTGYTVDTKGRANKTGDATRRLMGMARVVTGPAWADSATQRLVRSRDNRKGIALVNGFTANRSTTSNSYVEVNSEIRCECLSWADEVVFAAISGRVIGSGSDNLYTSIGFDGATAEETMIYTTAGGNHPIGLSIAKAGLAEGYHYSTLLGRGESGGTQTWLGSGTAGTRTALTMMIGVGQ